MYILTIITYLYFLKSNYFQNLSMFFYFLVLIATMETVKNHYAELDHFFIVFRFYMF